MHKWLDHPVSLVNVWPYSFIFPFFLTSFLQQRVAGLLFPTKMLKVDRDHKPVLDNLHFKELLSI